MSDARAHQPPLSAQATSAPAAAQVDRWRQAQPSGWWGMVLFLCAEVTLFGTMIGSYFYLDFGSRRWPPAGIAPPSLAGPLISTGVLVAFTPALVLAVLAARRGLRWRAVHWTLLAFTVQCGFLAVQILLFRHDYNQFKPQGSAYGSIYFTLLATHDAHVLVGLLLDIAVLWMISTRGLTNYWLIGLRGLALYWYVVNALAVVVALVVLSPSL